MAIVFGASGQSVLGWNDARAKVRGDLWRTGESGVPTDVVDRWLHASLQELEGERRWLWLENTHGALTVDDAADHVDLAGSIQSVSTISYTSNGFHDPLTLAPISHVRSMSRGSSAGSPSCYALTDQRIYFDTVVPAASEFELIFTARCPLDLATAIVSPSITLSRHPQPIIALTCSYVALAYLKNEDEAARQLSAYTRQLDRLMNTEDQQRGDTMGGGIVPDTAYYDAAHGC